MSENLISTENPLLRVHNLSKSQNGLSILHDIRFSLRRGEKIGLLGENGAGKTSLLRCIVGYWLPELGYCEVEGNRVTAESIETRAKLGYMPERVPLYPNLTAREHLQLAVVLKGRSGDYSSSDWHDIECQYGISEIAHRPSRYFSKGYRQRLGLAMAMLITPELLILDEPTSGLDPAQIVAVRDLLNHLNPTQGMIMSSHQLSEVHSVCDRILVIHKGRLVLDEPVSGGDIEAQFLAVTAS